MCHNNGGNNRVITVRNYVKMDLIVSLTYLLEVCHMGMNQIFLVFTIALHILTHMHMHTFLREFTHAHLQYKKQIA